MEYNNLMRLFGRWRLAIKILPLVILAVGLKIIVHSLNIEVLSLSPLFSGVVGATVFLLGFMIAGTLSDYKESERLPSDLAASLYSIADECSMITTKKGKQASSACLKALDIFTSSLLSWLITKKNEDKLFANIEQLDSAFSSLEPHIQAIFLNRIKTEQNQVRRIVLRMRTIRETSFIKTGYAIAEISTFLLIVALIFIKDQPYFESLFFVGYITFILTYLIALITDLDNPFSYGQSSGIDEVSLKPLTQFLQRIRLVS